MSEYERIAERDATARRLRIRMAPQEYDRYLQSKRWAILREDALNRFDYRCALCYSPYELEVHHRTYDRLGDEEPSDLIPLCADCHGAHHGALGARSLIEPQIHKGWPA